jgi:hypothetical protein
MVRLWSMTGDGERDAFRAHTGEVRRAAPAAAGAAPPFPWRFLGGW